VSQVQANFDLSKTRCFHIFQVQPYQCSLVGNGSMESELFLAYLHAITSCCLQNPLTRKTGTESALQIIGSARVASFLHLGRRSLDTLQLVGKLTPQRVYYSANLHDMQSVDWHPYLSFLSQHPRYHAAVESISLKPQGVHGARLGLSRTEHKYSSTRHRRAAVASSSQRIYEEIGLRNCFLRRGAFYKPIFDLKPTSSSL
jgi:hypothetical protein